MESPALSKTQNFFKLYMHVCGESEVPPIYHFWCCVGLLAATMEDRCWCEIYKDEPIKPHLYIGLIGPGSLGKGLAISHAIRLAEKSIITQIYRGKVTYAHLIDRMGKGQKDEWGRKILANPRLWLIMDELKNDVGANPKLTEEFISHMTELYTASNYKLDTGTRTHGEITLVNPNLNWLFGSTELWLRQVLTKDIFESGFVARCCHIFAEYDLDKRIPRIIYPPDRDEVYEHLRCRLFLLQHYSGRFLMTPTAEAEFDRWYCQRPKPEDEMLYSAWKRQKEHLLRFAMINSAADGMGMVIRHGHLVRAAQMIKAIEKFTARLIDTASETQASKPINDVGKYIQKKKRIGHSDLLRYMRTKKGYTAEMLKKAVWDLKAENNIEFETGEKGGQIYVWKG